MKCNMLVIQLMPITVGGGALVILRNNNVSLFYENCNLASEIIPCHSSYTILSVKVKVKDTPNKLCKCGERKKALAIP